MTLSTRGTRVDDTRPSARRTAIEQALRDLAGRGASSHDRDSARTFLAVSPMLIMWCEVAEDDPHWITGYLRKLPPGSD